MKLKKSGRFGNIFLRGDCGVREVVGGVVGVTGVVVEAAGGVVDVAAAVAEAGVGVAA